MKKTFLRLPMLFILPILLCSCVPARDNLSNKSLNEYFISNSIDITSNMADLAQSPEYLKLSSVSPEVNELIAEIGKDKYTDPSQAILITLPNTTVDAAIKTLVGELNLPDDVYEMVITRMLNSIPVMINAQQGALTIAATSLLNASKMFETHKDFAANTHSVYVILLYANRSSVTVFRNVADDITSASSTFLFPNDELKKAITDKTVYDYFSEMFNISEFEVESVSL